MHCCSLLEVECIYSFALLPDCWSKYPVILIRCASSREYGIPAVPFAVLVRTLKLHEARKQ